jgi:hypothetical protein
VEGFSCTWHVGMPWHLAGRDALQMKELNSLKQRHTSCFNQVGKSRLKASPTDFLSHVLKTVHSLKETKEKTPLLITFFGLLCLIVTVNASNHMRKHSRPIQI